MGGDLPHQLHKLHLGGADASQDSERRGGFVKSPCMGSICGLKVLERSHRQHYRFQIHYRLFPNSRGTYGSNSCRRGPLSRQDLSYS